MQINLNKNKFEAIDGAFLVLQENKNSKAALDIIKESLESCFRDYKFSVNIVTPNVNDSSLFIMSVYPEMSVIDKILDALTTNKDTDAIKKLWSTNKVWTIEIDSRMLDNSIIKCTNKELTAMLLHEVGHIVYSTSIPNRLSLILRYELMQAKMSNRMLLRDKVFRKLLSLPILDACISDNKKDKNSIKEEVKADSFSKKMGYQKELMSVLEKIMNNSKFTSSISANDKIIKNTDFSLKTLEDFQARRDKLAKKSLISLKESCPNPYIESAIDDILSTLFEGTDDSISLFGDKKVTYMQERADKDIEDGYYTEFFIFGKKQLKRIDPAEIDYINIKIQEIKNETDKMMIVSYIHSKLDIVDYYITLLSNPKLAKKYYIPYTMDELNKLKLRLDTLRKMAINFKIPERNKNILVAWPQGYEG